MTEQEAISCLKADKEYLVDMKVCDGEEIDVAINALEEIQQYHRMKKRLKAVYGECDGLLETAVEQALENAVSILENHEGVDIGHPYQSRLLTDEDVDKWEAYKAIGTPEEIQQKLAELERWHTTEINPKIKNVFANTSTLICHNCDHKDEYIEELEDEMEEYRAIGTPEECREAVEKMKPKRPDECEDRYYACPVCDNILLHKWIKYPTKLMPKTEGLPHCMSCGQAIDWSDKK